MPKGCKTCNHCGFCTGPRAYVCPKCNNPFVFNVKNKEKRTTKVIRDFNWRDLIKGDMIKVNGGPYFMNTDGEYIPMGCRGKFIVEGVDEKGILAWSTDKHRGFSHIYMGPDFHDKDTGLRKTCHRFLKLKRKEPV